MKIQNTQHNHQIQEAKNEPTLVEKWDKRFNEDIATVDKIIHDLGGYDKLTQKEANKFADRLASPNMHRGEFYSVSYLNPILKNPTTMGLFATLSEKLDKAFDILIDKGPPQKSKTSSKNSFKFI